MATTAKADEGTIIRIGNESFHFDDGNRQVTEGEEGLLREWSENLCGGDPPVAVTFTGTRKKGSSS